MDILEFLKSLNTTVFSTKNVVYCALNKINNKIYIGLTKNSLKQRIYGHVGRSKDNNEKSYFHNALSFHGKENFDWYILYESDKLENLQERESFYIKLFSSNNRNFGYNLSTGGESPKCSEETCKKISDAAKKRNVKGERNPFYGRKHSKETIKHFSDIRMGIPSKAGWKHTDECKKRLSNLRKEKVKDSQHILNMSLAQKNRITLLCITNNTVYHSVKFAAKQLNLSTSGLRYHLKRKKDTPYYGYLFTIIDTGKSN